MSIELPFFKALAKLPLHYSNINPRRSVKLNQKIYTSYVFTRKVELKQLISNKIMLTGSFNLNALHFGFGVEVSLSRTAAAAAEYENPLSDEYFRKDNGAEDFNEIQDSELGLAGGPDIQEGDGQGGNGHGGDGGMGKNNGRFGGSEGGDHGLLRGTEWWWWWQWQRSHKRRHSGLTRWGHSEPLRLADSVAQVVSTETIKSIELVVHALMDFLRQLKLDELAYFVLVLPFFIPLFFRLNDEIAQVTYMTFGAILALTAVFLVAALGWVLFWWNNTNQHDENDSDNDNDNDDGNYGGLQT